MRPQLSPFISISPCKPIMLSRYGVRLAICEIKYLSADNYDPVISALTFRRVKYDPGGQESVGEGMEGHI
jgi:hypothetical protein